MDKSYAAFGLSLRSSFPLPGMPEGDREGEGLPRVDIALESPAELEAAWSGSHGSSPWQGRLGDGQRLTIERGVAGDLRFGYGERASFRFDPTRGRLSCAPRDAARLDWQRVLLNRVLPNVGIAHGHEALHASAVETALGVVAIAAPSGTGKSTLASELMRRGWPLFADDVLILARRPGGIEAEPGAPQMNVAAGATVAERLGETLGVLAGERWIAVPSTSSRARRVAAIVLFERAAGLELEARTLPGSPLALAPCMLGVPDDEERDAARFALYSDLVESARLVRVGGHRAVPVEDFADAVEAELGLSSPLSVRGAA
jgi:hypothetical protein